MHPSAGLQVGEVRTLVPGCAVLAGESGLSRTIHSVGVMEAPDSLQFVKVGDLVLTALWAIRHDQEAQLRLIPELIAKGAAGLAIKLSYVGGLPSTVLELANAHAFPVLQLPAEIPYSEVMAPIIGQIVNRQARVLERQQRAQKAVVQAMLEAKGVQRLANTLAELVENPVVITDQAGMVLAVGEWGDAAAGLQLQQLAGVEASSTEYILSARDTVHGVESVIHQGRRLIRVVTPVKTGNHVLAHVQAWEFEKPIGEIDLGIIDSVTTVIALELTNQRALTEVERRYQNEFLAALFARQIDSEADLSMRARRFGWDLTRPHYAVAVKVSLGVGRSPAEIQEIQAIQEVEEAVYDAVSRSVGNGAVVGQAELHTVILLPPKARGDAKADGLAVARQLKGHAEAVSPHVRIHFGIGTVQSGVSGLRRSFYEARQAARVGERVGGGDGVYHYSDLGLYQIMAMLQPAPELTQFLAGTRQLHQYDQAHATELVPTLEAYFLCKGNVRKVSEKMFAHYNTILYRLQRIEQITGMSLDDADGRLSLQVALQAAKLFDKEWAG